MADSSTTSTLPRFFRHNVITFPLITTAGVALTAYSRDHCVFRESIYEFIGGAILGLMIALIKICSPEPYYKKFSKLWFIELFLRVVGVASGPLLALANNENPITFVLAMQEDIVLVALITILALGMSIKISPHSILIFHVFLLGYFDHLFPDIFTDFHNIEDLTVHDMITRLANEWLPNNSLEPNEHTLLIEP